LTEAKKQIVKQFIGHHVGLTNKILIDDFVNYMKHNGIHITPQQFTTLARLNREDGITQKELANYLNKDYGSITRSLDGLEKRDWVRREDSSKDRRTKLVFITEQGKKIFNSVLPLQIERNRQLLNGVSEKDFEQLITILSKVRDNSK